MNLRLQFSIRALLFVVALCSVPLGVRQWYVAAGDYERGVGAEIMARGYHVEMLEGPPAWLETMLWMDVSYISKVSLLGASRRDTEELVPRLGSLQRLRQLTLSGADVVDADLDVLFACPRLNGIALDRTRITDRGLQSLTACQEIEVVSVANTAVSDAGIRVADRLPRVVEISVWNTKVTRAGAQELRRLRKVVCDVEGDVRLIEFEW
jgi:hypothetical protein